MKHFSFLSLFFFFFGFNNHSHCKAQLFIDPGRSGYWCMWRKHTGQKASGEGPPVTTGPQRPGSEAHLHVCAPDNTSHCLFPATDWAQQDRQAGLLLETRDSSGRQVHSKTSQSLHVGLGCFHQACLPSGRGMHCSWATLSAFSGSFPFSPDEIPATCLLRLCVGRQVPLPPAPRGKPVPVPHLPHDGRAALPDSTALAVLSDWLWKKGTLSSSYHWLTNGGGTCNLWVGYRELRIYP